MKTVASPRTQIIRLLSLALLNFIALPLHAAPGDLEALNLTVVGEVRTSAVQPDGKLIIAGDFTSVLGVTRSRIAGVSTVASPAETAKHGYIGQLYEVTALQIAATPTTVNEGATRQLSCAQLLDDNTTIALAANSITWSIQSGPLTSISTGGLATAAAVYQNTAATAQGDFAGNTGTLGLTVIETIADNFGAYAADGLGDDWQVQYFGLNNPNAAPLLDPDFDGHNNHFEFTAGIVPTDALSVFNLRIDSVPAFPAQKNLIFSPRLAGRTYTVKTSPTLGTGAVWSTLTGGITTNNGAERTVTDTNATGGAKFYSVEIVKP